MKPISNRLEALCSMVTPGLRLADVGCDHGFLSIALVGRGIAPSAIAMDLREGPLGHAKENIAREGLSDVIETRLSDGLTKLTPGEAETIVIAGMGGRLLMHILEEGRAVAQAAKELILQPQSEIPLVRHYLVEQGYRLIDEEMLQEDGKYYMMMKVSYEANGVGEVLAETKEDFLFGKFLLAKHHPVLAEYIRWEIGLKEAIRDKLDATDATHSDRYREVMEALEQLQSVLHQIEG